MRTNKVGLPPETVVYVGSTEGPVTIDVIDFTPASFTHKQVSARQCAAYLKKKSITWINVSGIHDVDIINIIGRDFKIHSLVLEDIAHTKQRPKIEDFGDYWYIVLRMLTPFNGEIITEQISLILGRGFVLSFQETAGDIFDPIRERIKESKGRIRHEGSDYLAYCLMDTIIDNYFVVLEMLGEQIEDIEQEITEQIKHKTLHKLHGLKKELIHLRKSVWPLREVTNSIIRSESTIIGKTARTFFRDVYDHTIQVMDTVETYRDTASGMVELYMSSVSNRMNEVMKVLTIIATIFIPLTFIVGIYGMNFRYMPELQWKLGYLLVWVVMIATAGAMFIFFKKKRWI
ncbi:MAG TPA: magnesium/cobalt transporter CorA [Candidatus Nanoarchaeia archaeon]|nr:magnesium/cobalt transporter CorA [Candidatus Nanoarchaeia archaeon]